MVIKPEELMESLIAIRSTGKVRKGESFGWESIDEFMLANKKYLFLLTGYPSYGKSTFIDAMAINLSKLHGWKWLYFSTETDDYTTHLRKLVGIVTGKGLQDTTNEELIRVVLWINKFFTWINPPKDKFLSLDDVLDITRERINSGQTVDALVIDPWNELRHTMTEREDQYIANCLMKVKSFAKANDLLALLAIHPKTQEKNQDGSFPIPHLRNVSGGSMWWNKADYGICVHRKDFSVNGVFVYIQKVKDSTIGRQGMTFLDCDPVSLRLKDQHAREFTLPVALTDLPY